MKRRNNEAVETLFSPAVDVLANSMLIMFIYLVFFMATAIVPDRIAVTPCQAPPCIVGLNYDFVIPTSGGKGKRHFAVIGELPKGVDLEPSAGRLKGTVASDAVAGRSELQITVSDSTGSSSNTLVLETWETVVPHQRECGVRIISETERLPTGRVGVPYDAAIGHSGGAGALSWEVVGSNLNQSGLTFKDGRFYGIPRQAGKYTCDVLVTSSICKSWLGETVREWEESSDRHTCVIEILESISVESIWPRVRVDTEFVGGTVERLLAEEKVVFQGLPEGLTPSPHGTVTGRAMNPGHYDIGVEVYRDSARVAHGGGRLEVLPKIDQATADQVVQTVRVGDKPIRIAIPYRGLFEPVVVSETSRMPEGIIVSGCGLSVQAVAPGMYSIDVKLRDATDNVVETKVTLRVLPSVQPMEIITDGPVDLIADRDISWRIPVRGGEGEPIITVEGEIPGLKIANGALSGRIPNPGEWIVKIRMTDSFSKKAIEKDVKVRATPLVFLRSSPEVE